MSIYQSTKVSPYVYQLTHKVTGQFYIGYREVNIVPSDQDLGFFYWTSSKKVEPIFFEFNIQILAEFFDGDSAWYQEQRIIEANIKNPLCLNGYYVKDGKNKFSIAGTTRSIETRAKTSKSTKGIINLGLQEKVKCLYCPKEGGKSNMNRYHFDNCAFKDIEYQEITKMTNGQFGTRPPWNKGRKGVQNAWNKGISSSLKGILSGPQEKVKCPHCPKEGGLSVMKRWHFDNCKHHLNP